MISTGQSHYPKFKKGDRILVHLGVERIDTAERKKTARTKRVEHLFFRIEDLDEDVRHHDT